MIEFVQYGLVDDDERIDAVDGARAAVEQFCNHRTLVGLLWSYLVVWRMGSAMLRRLEVKPPKEWAAVLPRPA